MSAIARDTSDYGIYGSNLCDRPEFFDPVADRMWRAWWQPKGHSFSQVSVSLRTMLKDRKPIPFGLVAHKNDLFLGSTLGIASDLEERPDYTPWVAAVWTEPEHRGKDIGRTWLPTLLRLALRAASNASTYALLPDFETSTSVRAGCQSRKMSERER
jgi:hypothetical protein